VANSLGPKTKQKAQAALHLLTTDRSVTSFLFIY